jgi:intracellular sulfur oxidation DsrE/DsrF family protein
MKNFLTVVLLALSLGVTAKSYAQSPQFPIVKGFGGIYEISDATERPDPSREYKILVDMSTGAEDNKQISRWVDNVARMINLHGLAGVPKENINVKVVVHGSAVFTLLNDENYKERFGVDNPNLKVYEALKAAGVDVMVCGQSLVSRNMKTGDLWSGVRVAHSALTTITTYVPQGYILLKF